MDRKTFIGLITGLSALLGLKGSKSELTDVKPMEVGFVPPPPPPTLHLDEENFVGFIDPPEIGRDFVERKGPTGDIVERVEFNQFPEEIITSDPLEARMLCRNGDLIFLDSYESFRAKDDHSSTEVWRFKRYKKIDPI